VLRIADQGVAVCWMCRRPIPHAIDELPPLFNPEQAFVQAPEGGTPHASGVKGALLTTLDK